MSEKMCMPRFRAWLTLRLVEARRKYPHKKALLDILILNAISVDRDSLARLFLMLDIASSEVEELARIRDEIAEKYFDLLVSSEDEKGGDYEYY